MTHTSVRAGRKDFVGVRRVAIGQGRAIECRGTSGLLFSSSPPPPTDGPDRFASFEEGVDNRTAEKKPGRGTCDLNEKVI